VSDLVLNVTDKKEGTYSVTPLEYFDAVVRIPGGASDTSVQLGLCTNPKFVAIWGGPGITWKIAAGTDVLGANPQACISNDDGLGIAAILVSNSGGAEAEVRVIAEE